MDSQKEKESYFYEIAEQNAYKPSPAEYIRHPNWNKAKTSKTMRQPGTFSDRKRMTFTEEMIKIKKEIPGSNKYKNTRFDKYMHSIPGTLQQKAQRVYPYLESQAISKSRPMPYTHQANLYKSYDFT